MKTSDVQVSTNDRYEFVTITGEVQNVVRESGVEDGFCIISSTHTTGAITVNEDYDRTFPGISRPPAELS